MTLEELVNLKISKELIITDGIHDYTLEKIESNYINDYPRTTYIFTDINTNVVNNISTIYYNMCCPSLLNPMKLRWLQILSIKKETTFKQEPTKTLNNSFPKFMKSKTTSLTVLFFNEDSGIVVVEDNSAWKVNDFSTTWAIYKFEPIENCEVTFSNKE